LYSSPYLSRYTPIRSAYYYDALYRPSLYNYSSVYRPYYSYYYTSPSYVPYLYSSLAYSNYIASKYYDVAAWRAYRRRYYDDEYISYYSYSKYLQDKYDLEKAQSNNTAKKQKDENKKMYYDDNLFGYDTPAAKQ